MLIFMAALLAQDTPFQQTPYWACLVSATKKLERSGERPRDVAAAALDVCHSKQPDYSANFNEALHSVLIEKLADQVVEIRASRH